MSETTAVVKDEGTKERGRRRLVEAVVINSGTQDKTVKCQLEFLVKHPRYNKYLRKRTRLQVHDEKNEAKVGDMIQIRECRPVSKTKNWTLVKVVAKAKV
jgi:small subunit ribosomal protein S17